MYVLAFFLLLCAVLYRQELARLVHAFYHWLSNPLRYEELDTEPVLASQMKQTEQRMADTERALNKFSHAIEKYAAHLSSHTGAIQGLNAASQELQKGAAQQNRVLMHLMKNADNPATNQKKTPHWRVDPTPLKPPTTETPAVERPTVKHESGTQPVIPVERKITYPPGCARNRLKKTEEIPATKADKFPDISPRMPEEITVEPESLDSVRKHVADMRLKSGKTPTRSTLAAEALAAEEEIMKAIKKLNARLDESELQE